MLLRPCGKGFRRCTTSIFVCLACIFVLYTRHLCPYEKSFCPELTNGARRKEVYLSAHSPAIHGRDGVFRRIIRPAPGNSHLACRSHKKSANKGLPSFRKVGGEGKGVCPYGRTMPRPLGKGRKENGPQNTWQGPGGRLSADCGQNDCI